MESKSSSSQTQTIVRSQESKESKTLILTLRERIERRVTWENEVVNNEKMGKKSSKSVCTIKYIYAMYVLLLKSTLLGCCIFHKKKKFAESDSDESDSDIEEAEQSEPKDGQHKLYQRHHA